MPGLRWAWFGHHNKGVPPGCFYAGAGINMWELLFWELILTFVLVYVIYAVAVAEPGHGNVGPLVMGITLWIASEAGESMRSVTTWVEVPWPRTSRVFFFQTWLPST